MHSEELAENLWSRNEDGSTWEYVYFLDDINDVEIPISDYNQAMGYADKYIIQGFNVHDGERASRLLDLIELDGVPPDSDTSMTKEQATKALDELESMTQDGSSKRRQEAKILRGYLFGTRASADCAFCGRTLPQGLLVAAHIKPRSSCTDLEKRDPNVVMRACKLGCDELFERGYVYVSDSGAIERRTTGVNLTEDLEATVSSLVGRQCTAHSKATEEYFRWRSKHRRRLSP